MNAEGHNLLAKARHLSGRCVGKNGVAENVSVFRPDHAGIGMELLFAANVGQDRAAVRVGIERWRLGNAAGDVGDELF